YTGYTGYTGPQGITGPTGAALDSSFYASLSTGGNFIIAANTTTQLTSYSTSITGQFNTGDFNAASGIFTVPATGKWNLSCSLLINTAINVSLLSGSVPELRVCINSSSITAARTNLFIVNVLSGLVSLTIQSPVLTINCDLSLTQGDTVF